MDGCRCRLASPEPVASLIRACLGRYGLQVTAIEREDLDIALIDADSFDPGTFRTPEGAPVIRMSTRPEVLACTCGRDDVCLCRITLPFSPPALIIRVRAALAAARHEPPVPRASAAERAVLDLCSGSGCSTCEAADAHGPGTLVVGVDRSPEAAVEARALAHIIGYGNVAFVAADAAALPFGDGSFDAVTGEEQLGNWLRSPQALERARAEGRRVLRG